MDFELDEQLRLIRKTAREFADADVAPTADRRDREHAFPRAEFQAAAELGFAGMLVPEEYGGTALGTAALALVIEEVSRACASTGVTISVHNSLTCSPIVRHGTPEQKAQWLPRLATGELLGAYALSEANAGSDAAALRCKARRDGDRWVLDGAKLWITSGNEADLIIVFARAEEGISAFLVPTDSKGFSVGKVEEKLGIRSSSTVEIVLDGVAVPAGNLLGSAGKGLQVAFDTLDGGRIGIAAQALGIAQASLDASIRYAGQREQFGVAIARFQAVQFKLAQVSADLAAARLMTWRAAWLRDHDLPHTLEAAQAKLLASQVANRAADEAVQIHGGAGYTTEFPVARYFRDARITEIYEGTSEIQRIVIARRLLAGS
ncbi:MAG TPA: acyl-CoA dehydrogenase family protein [Planctomycetota bacterium]|nr:acyl-CoA dehydrogenase family protein [Planctomycetota bacterium]